MSIKTMDERLREQAHKDFQGELEKAAKAFQLALGIYQEPISEYQRKIRVNESGGPFPAYSNDLLNALVKTAFERGRDKVGDAAVQAFMQRVDELSQEVAELRDQVQGQS